MLNEFRSTSITWDKATRRIYSPITANASDSNGRKLNIQVVNSGQVENLTGATLHLYWETKDKSHYGLDAFNASDISKGEFEIFYTTGMLSNVGELNATLVLVDGTGKVVSDWFKITVTRGINEGAIESENSFSSLTQALIDISNLEQNYAPRLNDLTAQLAQTAKKSEVDELQTRMNDVIQSADLDPNKDQEIVDARGGSATLNDRLSDFDEKLTNVENLQLRIGNEIINGNFSEGTTGWVGMGGSSTVNSNTLTLTGTGGSSLPRAQSNVGFVTGRMYYLSARQRVTNSNAEFIGFGTDVIVQTVQSPIINQWYENSMVFTATTDTVVRLSQGYVDSAAASGKVMQVKNVILIDLTSTFGMNKEPEKKVIDNLIKDLGGWFDGEKTVGEKLQTNWLLSTSNKVDNIVSVRSYSHLVVSGDWTEAIRAASAELKDKGGGKLVFPKDEYKVFSASIFTDFHLKSFAFRTLYDFGNTTVEFDFCGSTITSDQKIERSKYWTYFKFTDAKNITLHDLNHYSADANLSAGSVVLHLVGACNNISVYNVAGQGIDRLILAEGDVITYKDAVMNNVTAWNIDLTKSYKPFTFRHGIRGIKIWNYRVSEHHRAFHGMGIEDVDIQLEAENHSAATVLFTCYYESQKLGAKNVKVDINVLDETPHIQQVELAYTGRGMGNPLGGGIFENIDLNLNLNLEGTTKPNLYAYMVSSWANDYPLTAQTEGQGHILKNISFSGNMKGERLLLQIRYMQEGDYISDIKIQDLISDASTRDTEVDLTALTGSFIINNLQTDANFVLKNVPNKDLVKVYNSKMKTGSDDSSPIEFIDSVIVRGQHNKTNKTYINTKIDETYFISNKKITSSSPSEVWFDLVPNIAYSEIQGLANLTTTTITIPLQNKGMFATARSYQPSIFNIQAGYQNASSTLSGIVLGKIRLMKTSDISTQLNEAKILEQKQYAHDVENEVTVVIDSNVDPVTGDLIITFTGTEGMFDRISVLITA